METIDWALVDSAYLIYRSVQIHCPDVRSRSPDTRSSWCKLRACGCTVAKNPPACRRIWEDLGIHLPTRHKDMRSCRFHASASASDEYEDSHRQERPTRPVFCARMIVAPNPGQYHQCSYNLPLVRLRETRI